MASDPLSVSIDQPPSETCVAGVDVGSLTTASYVAWLCGSDFLLDMYRPSADTPLPRPPAGFPQVTDIAFDVPQGLAAAGSKRRLSDAAANTPTRVLPPNRVLLGSSVLYAGLIRAGVEIFWNCWEQSLAKIAGLPESSSPAGLVIMESYPRYVIRRKFPSIVIPSKRQRPYEYVAAVWSALQEAGYRCRGVVRPSVDQVDAMLCAIAAEAYYTTGGHAPGTVGAPPYIDVEGRVLREGFIVSP